MKLKAYGTKVLCSVRYYHWIWTEVWRK